MKLKQKLIKARENAGLSMAQVARESAKMKRDHRSHITQGYISRLESGKETNPSYLKLITLCRIYGIEPGTLF